MIGHGSAYQIARQMEMLDDLEMNIVRTTVKLDLVRQKIRENLHRAYLKNEKSYNLRCREVKYVPGQEVYWRNFQQSVFKNNFNAKLAKKFLKCRIVRPVGRSLYEIEDMQGKILGIFYGKI